MQKPVLTLFLLLALAVSARSQIVSKWTWESGSVTTPDIGPSGSGQSTFATASTGGNPGSGLNAGPGSHNINMSVPANSPGQSLLIPGIDISVDFRKEEQNASFFTMGNFDFGVATGAIYVKYSLTGVAGQITQNNVFTVMD